MPAVPSLKAWDLIRSTLSGTSGPPRPHTLQTCGHHTLPRRMSELPLLLPPTQLLNLLLFQNSDISEPDMLKAAGSDGKYIFFYSASLIFADR